MKLGRKRRNHNEVVELNITAFLNLMVILVPFLLITAVFSRMTVLELNLPALDALNAQAKENPEVKLQLQIVITPEDLIVQDANLGEMKRIARLENSVPVDDPQRKIWKPLSDILLEIKSRFPQEQNVTLLVDRAVNYKSMIEVIDHVRSADIVQSGTLETVELFPSISIGDIPTDDVLADDEVTSENQAEVLE